MTFCFSLLESILQYERDHGLGKGFFRNQLIGKTAFKRLEDGQLTKEEFFAEFEKECDHKVVAKDWLESLERSLKPQRAMIDMAVALKRSGFMVGIITNNWKGKIECDISVQHS